MSESQFGQAVMDTSYEQLVKYCSHSPKKDVISTITEQKMVSSNLGYEYVSQLYLRKRRGEWNWISISFLGEWTFLICCCLFS